MYINNEERKAKIGKVSVSVSRYDSINIRFTYPKGKRHDINVSTNTDEGWINALRIAQAINADIELGHFDDTLAKYSPRRSQTLELANKEPNLLEIWERYKELNHDRIAATSQAYWWKDVDRYLNQTPKALISLDKAQEFLQYLQTKYAASTINTLFRSFLHPAINSGIQGELVESNPFYKLTFPKQIKKPIQCYEPEEINLISSCAKLITYI